MSRLLKEAKQTPGESRRAAEAPGKRGEFERGFAEGVQSAWALLDADCEPEARRAESGTRAPGGELRLREMKIEKQEIGFADICRLHAAFPCWW